MGLTNTSDFLASSYASATLTGCDAQGTITFSYDLYFPLLRPGDTTHMAEFVADAAQTVDVSAKVTVPDYGLTRWAGTTGQLVDVKEVSYKRGDLGLSDVMGWLPPLRTRVMAAPWCAWTWSCAMAMAAWWAMQSPTPIGPTWGRARLLRLPPSLTRAPWRATRRTPTHGGEPVAFGMGRDRSGQDGWQADPLYVTIFAANSL